MTITQVQMEANEAILGVNLMLHLKAYIQSYVNETAALTDIDIGALSEKVASIVAVVDGDPESEGYQAFTGLLADVAALKTDNTSNKQRLTAVEAALSAMDAEWRAEMARVESESKTRDTALGQRIDTLQTDVGTYAAARLAKDIEHDSRLAALEAAKDTLVTNLAAEVTRTLAREAELAAAIQANRTEIDTIKASATGFAARNNVDSGFVAFCIGASTELWEGKTMPAGLPEFTTAVDAVGEPLSTI